MIRLYLDNHIIFISFPHHYCMGTEPFHKSMNIPSTKHTLMSYRWLKNGPKVAKTRPFSSSPLNEALHKTYCIFRLYALIQPFWLATDFICAQQLMPHVNDSIYEQRGGKRRLHQGDLIPIIKCPEANWDTAFIRATICGNTVCNPLVYYSRWADKFGSEEIGNQTYLRCLHWSVWLVGCHLSDLLAYNAVILKHQMHRKRAIKIDPWRKKITPVRSLNTGVIFWTAFSSTF